MQMNKKGAMDAGGVVNKWVYGIIMFVVLFLVVAALMPSLELAGNNISNGNFFGAISGLFASGGVIFLIIGAALITFAVAFFLSHRQK